MPGFHLDVHDDPTGVRVMAVQGEARVEISDQLTREALEAIGPLEHPRVALDLSGLDFIDSASTGALVHLREVIETERGGSLVLCGLKRVVRRVLDVTGLACRFDIREDRADALAHLTDS